MRARALGRRAEVLAALQDQRRHRRVRRRGRAGAGRGTSGPAQAEVDLVLGDDRRVEGRERARRSAASRCWATAGPLVERRPGVPRHRGRLADGRVARDREVARRAERVEALALAQQPRQRRAVAAQRGVHGGRDVARSGGL